MVAVFPQSLEHESLILDPATIDFLAPRPLKLSVGDEPSMEEMTKALIMGMSNWNAVGPDGRPN